MYVSEISTVAPTLFKRNLQKSVYNMLRDLGICYERVDTDEVVTMDDCRLINEKLSMNMVKTLFLCNREKDKFFLFVTYGSKAFSTKGFAKAAGTSRVSFAPSDLLSSMLGVKVGAVTVFSKLLSDSAPVQVVIDQGVANSEWYGCSDGTTTSYLRIKVSDVLDKFMPHVVHEPLIVSV